MYTREKWIEYHGEKVAPEDYDREYKKWLKWRLSVDRGETRSQIMAIVRPDVGYESPATGEIITSEKARINDLAKSGCVEYDPEMRTDYKNKIKADEKRLDKQLDDVVDKTFEQLPSKKRDALVSEIASGVDINIERLTVEK